jgi:thymidylate synthase (FAD)
MIEKIDLYGDGIGSVEYVEHMGSDLTIVNSARVSFGKHKDELDEKDKKLIKYLVEHRHTSTFEHNVVTFRFVVPLFIRSQHHRHRTWSYNEISRRYTDFDLKFYEPQKFRTQHKTNRQASNLDSVDPIVYPDLSDLDFGVRASECIKSHHERSLTLYNNLIDSGVCREQARGILPQNLYTEYYGTCNLSNLLRFVDLRTHEGGKYNRSPSAVWI